MKNISFLVFLIPALVFAEVNNFSIQRLDAHVRFLASDLLEGRGTGTRGYGLAALYVASQFEQLGLKPAGVNGTYMQPVPFRKSDILPEECSFIIRTKDAEQKLKYGEHYLMSGDYVREKTAVSAEVVFAGHGITAPDLKYDDYAPINAVGKIVLLLSGAPASFPTSERAHYSSGLTKQQNAAKHGAVAIITLLNPEDEPRSPWERSVRQNKLSGYHWVDKNGKPTDVPLQIQANVSLSRSGAEMLFQKSSMTSDEIFRMWRNKTLRSFPLNIQVSLMKGSRLATASSPNVVGMMEGSDPKLKTEYVVYTAHLDHLGISDPVKNDTINNGAYDNATGIASLIEMARAFTSLKMKPLRSIIFLAVTGEEKGLQGSDFFVHKPTVPVRSIVANVNTDMTLMLYPFADAVAFGAEHSSLGPVTKSALTKAGLKMTPDPAPEEVRFVRSDQYSFIKAGIPAITLGSGFQSLDPNVKGAEATRAWLRTIYHSPQDESTQKMNWESGVKIVQANFMIGYEVANARRRPSWNAGDFFGKTFGHKLTQERKGAK
jgi:Peptidase family M28